MGRYTRTLLEGQLAEIAQELTLRGEAAERKRLAEAEALRQKRIRREAAMEEARVQHAEAFRVRHFETQEAAWRHSPGPIRERHARWKTHPGPGHRWPYAGRNRLDFAGLAKSLATWFTIGAPLWQPAGMTAIPVRPPPSRHGATREAGGGPAVAGVRKGGSPDTGRARLLPLASEVSNRATPSGQMLTTC